MTEPQANDEQVLLETLEGDDEVEVRHYRIRVRRRLPGKRLDAYLAARFPDYSRTFIQRLIEAGGIELNGARVKRSYRVQQGDEIDARVPTLKTEVAEPEDIPLDILYEDAHILVVNKPADMVVHPSRGHARGTLVNALAHHCRNLSSVGGPLRPGIVHRLDKDTTGVILVVKNDRVHQEIARQFEYRETRKEYVAITEGQFELDGDLIDLPLGKHRTHKEMIAVRPDSGRPSQTVYEVVERLGPASIVRCFPKTGRTHQIRVHLAATGHPILADALYGRSDAVYASDLTGQPASATEEPLIARQALHARRLTIHHPVLCKPVMFEAPLPPDMRRLVAFLRERFGGQRRT
jgi:23S rRNA pseudouridine1911/1915/1917 synthase